MPDPELRKHQRAYAESPHDTALQAAMLRAQLRAGQSVPVPWLREIQGVAEIYKGDRVEYETVLVFHGEHRAHWPDAPLRDILWIKAYVGDPVSRELLTCPLDHSTVDEHPIYGSGWHLCEQFQDHEDINPSWTSGFSDLAAALPAIRVSGVSCGSTGLEACVGPPDPCDGPSCTGKIRVVEIPADRYLAALIAEAVGRAVWIESGGTDVQRMHSAICTCCAPRRALDAVAQWLYCPCPVQEEACRELVPLDSAGMAYSPPGGEFWVRALLTVTHTLGHLESALTSAAEQIGFETVRKVARSALV